MINVRCDFGEFLYLSLGVWMERNQFIVPPDTHDTTATLTGFSDASDTDPLNLSSASTSSLSSSRNSDSFRGQNLQGAWGSSNITAAARIRRNIGQNVLPSRPTTPGSRRGSFGESSLSGSSTPQRHPSNTDLRSLLSSSGSAGPTPRPAHPSPWKPKDNQDLNRSHSSDDRRPSDGNRQDRRRGGGAGGGGAGKKGSGYYRSVSDNSFAQGQRHHGRGGGGANKRHYNNPRQPASEPINKRK